MSDRKVWTVPEGNIRLDRFLADHTDFSRSYLQKLIAQDFVRVDGQPTRSNRRLRNGEKVELTLPQPDAAVSYEALPKDWILYEDKSLLVINKPAGLVAHPAKSHHGDTLAEILFRSRPELRSLEWEGLAPLSCMRAGLVHRLDKDTSGVLVMAKTPQAQASVTKQFADRTVHKEYLAIVHGRPRAKEGFIRAPIGRSPKNPSRMAIHPQGRAAQTSFTVLKKAGEYSLLRVKPLTGRTHQIRVHLAAVGLPVAGDPLYGTPPFPCARQMLHAHKLALIHPKTIKKVTFTAFVPGDFRSFWQSLGGKSIDQII